MVFLAENAMTAPVSSNPFIDTPYGRCYNRLAVKNGMIRSKSVEVLIMKKTVVLILVLVLATGLLSACGGQKDSEKLQIVTTVFPEYDWVKNVLGQHSRSAEITLLCDNGVDMHSYQPTAEDIMKISTCDLFIYVGGESDAWVKKALEKPKNKNRVVINLMEVLGDAVKEEVIEGMQEEEHGHEHEDGEEDDHAEESSREEAHEHGDGGPEINEEICVAGVFDTYEENGYTYCTLREASLL